MTIEWRPDTCDCILRYDEMLPNGDPKWVVGESTMCEFHPTAQAALNSNRQKNQEINSVADRMQLNAEELGFKWDGKTDTFEYVIVNPEKDTPENRNALKNHVAAVRHTQ
jgi:hypothetical protein